MFKPKMKLIVSIHDLCFFDFYALSRDLKLNISFDELLIGH